MSQNKRKQNEKEYPEWTELENGGRMYSKELSAGDKSGKTAVYEKTVDENEKTLTFVQKIRDKHGNIIEIHDKFPIDKGHIILMLLLLIITSIVTYNFI